MEKDELLHIINRSKGKHVLNLSCMGLKNLPKEIGQLTQLTGLDLTSNKLTTLPPEIGKLINLSRLHLDDNELTELPQEIGQLTDLNTLNLSDNKLEMIPSEIGRLTDLRHLNLSGNQLKTLPPEIGQLNNLSNLNLSGNFLTTIPPEIGELAALTKLFLSHNELTELPPEIGQLANLNGLDLDSNNLARLSPKIKQLINLIGLDLTHNELIELPHEIGHLINLTWLFLGTNKITNLPREILNLSNLNRIDLRGNPLPIPPEILEQPDKPKEILTYYFTHFQVSAERKPLNEAKMLLVGEGYVGKTSLVRRLLEDRFSEREPITAGIDIKRWQIGGGRSPTQINIWDFGGQEIMHATHQFFLTKRSLYLLVLNSRQNEQANRLEYWLKIIHSFGGDSPVIVVCNQCDEREMDLNWTGLQKKYPNIKDFMKRISCKTGEGIEELRSRIVQEVSRLEHIHNELLASWFEVKNRLANMVTSGKDHISYSEYQEICREHEILDENSQRTLISFLHDLGLVLHFRDHPILADTNVLNPKWVTKGVYQLLNANELFQKKGVLEKRDLDHILDPQVYLPSKHMFIINIMNRFELCFEFEGADGEKYLVPDLLPVGEPDTGDWHDSLGFQYHYEVLPLSLISRFIVRMNPFISKKTYWRHGVVLKDMERNNRALVKADLEDKKIFISVSGHKPTRRSFLAIIRAEFFRIHQTIFDLGVKAKIPIPPHTDITVDYDNILAYEKEGMEFIIPDGLTKKIRVKDLLEGYSPEEAWRKSSDFYPMSTIMNVVMGDKYMIESIDWPILAKELEALRKFLLREANEANTLEHYAVIGDVTKAEMAAREGNGPKAIEWCSRSGKWVFDVASKIGIGVATEAVKKFLWP